MNTVAQTATPYGPPGGLYDRELILRYMAAASFWLVFAPTVGAVVSLKFNFYDVLVMAIDEQVLREQVAKATRRLERETGISTQRKLNFEMSVKNLYQSFQDRERVPKIQGLVNECMTFLDDELSVITGPYEDLLSIEEVIEKELILFVTLNVNKNTEPVRALGKMLLQNIQLVVGKRYESEEERMAKEAANHGPRGGRRWRRSSRFSFHGVAGCRSQPLDSMQRRNLSCCSRLTRF